MDFEAKIAELGLLIPKPAKPAGSYKPCVIVDNIAYISGQGPLLEDGSFAKGKVGADVDLETAQNHARLCGLAILSALKYEIGSINKVDQLIKLTGFDFDVDNKISQMPNPDTNRINILRDKIAPMVSEFYPEFANRIWGI